MIYYGKCYIFSQFDCLEGVPGGRATPPPPLVVVLAVATVLPLFPDKTSDIRLLSVTIEPSRIPSGKLAKMAFLSLGLLVYL